MHEISLRSTAVGLFIGSLVLCANFQFGLQTGWVSMMSMPAALLGFSIFKALRTALSPQENVYIQSVAVAVGTGPLAFGFVGAIPAIELLISPEEGRTRFSISELIVWSFGISFMGIFTAKLLRLLIIEKEKLTFPSGSAAAALIGVLHGKKVEGLALTEPDAGHVREAQPETLDQGTYNKNARILSCCFVGSSTYSVLSLFVPWLRQVPIFGTTAAEHLWVLQLSPAYVGQGVVMGPHTTVSMLLGMLLGWAVLAPLAQRQGWAPGDVGDWNNGAQGWIVWVSLAVMVADTSVSLGALIINVVRDNLLKVQQWRSVDIEFSPDTAPEQTAQVKGAESESQWVSAAGLAAASLLCIAVAKLLFRAAPIIQLTVAVAVAPIFSILAIRALGETDLNPVSSLAKLTQFLFGAMLRNHPRAVLLNIVAGAITEAGAQQAGDLMQDFKTGALLGASSWAQFVGMAIGTCWSIVLSALVYKLYNSIHTIPNEEFRIPTAFIWMDTARLMAGQDMPPHVGEFCLGAGALFFLLALWRFLGGPKYIPSGVAVGVGIYSVPSFTLARFIGGMIALYVAVKFRDREAERLNMILGSSGLILGEGIVSVLALIVNLGARA